MLTLTLKLDLNSNTNPKPDPIYTNTTITTDGIIMELKQCFSAFK